MDSGGVAPADSSTAGDGDAAATPSNPCDDAVADAPYRDHRSDEEFTDPADCSDCPGSFSGVTGLEGIAPTATTTTVSGTSAGAGSCEVYVEGQQCGVVRATAATDPDGAGTFVSTVPLFCGQNIVRIVCRNNAGTRVLVRNVAGTECDENGRDVRLTLSWDTVGDDLELHLIHPSGRINDPQRDCTWFTCMSGALDWGETGNPADNPSKDIDDLDILGPENVYLDGAENGVYDVMVEYWGSGAPASAMIAIAIRETTVATLGITGLREHHVWHVGRLVFPEGRFVETDRVIDCVSDWQTGENRGCAMDLPVR